MNIFVLDPNPAIAASYHCDQHIHKMILESAQMLSTVAHIRNVHPLGLTEFYAPTHVKHPCVHWLSTELGAINWVIELCEALNNRRLVAGCDTHSSMRVIQAAIKYFCYNSDDEKSPKTFQFCGPAFIELANTKYPTVQSKYQAYYRHKYRQWLDTGRPMTYKINPVPPFMADLFSTGDTNK